MAPEVTTANASVVPALWKQLTWWILALPVMLVVALTIKSYYLLNYTHVLSGALWTGADLFLGFIVGPVMRRLEPLQRKAVITYLVPRTLLYMPIVAFTTGTAGWFLADWRGMWLPANPLRPWAFVALAIVLILSVQGMGVLLPNNLRIYRELQRPHPDIARISRINQTNLVLAGAQGVFQVLIILVMAHLRIG